MKLKKGTKRDADIFIIKTIVFAIILNLVLLFVFKKKEEEEPLRQKIWNNIVIFWND